MGYGQVGDEPRLEQDELWEELEPAYTWEQLVLPRRELELLRDLPAELRDLSATRVGYGHRESRPQKLTLLFAGPAGTGKTMAGQILAKTLDVPILLVDLPSVIPGEGDRFESVLDAARSSAAIVILDGLGTVQVQTGLIELLERSYAYPGIAIFELTTTGDLEAGLARRFDFAIEFPFPDRDAREEIWRGALPSDARVTEAALRTAAASRLSGAMIASYCAAAAELAADEGVPVRDRHLSQALDSMEEVEPARPVVLPPSLAPQAEVEAAWERVEVPPEPEPEPDPEPEAVEVPGPVEPEPEPEPLEPEPEPEAIEEPEPAEEPEPEAAPLPKSIPPPPPVARPEPAEPPAPKRSPVPRRPRPSPDTRPRRRRSSPPARPRPAVLAVAGTVLAAVLGFVIAHGGGGGSTGQKIATAGVVRVSYSNGWRRATPPAKPALGLTDELALSSNSGTLLVGRSSSGTGALPSSLPSNPSAPPQVVTIGGLGFYRYQSESPTVSVYALPSTAGTVVAACLATQPTPAFTSSCEGILGTIKLTSGTAVPLTQDIAYAGALDAVIGHLNAIRSTAGSQLQRARDAGSQASAATQLADAHAIAASALLRLNAGAATGANAALASALRLTGSAYSALARAAASNDAGGYATATASIRRADTSAAQAFAQLSKLGVPAG